MTLSGFSAPNPFLALAPHDIVESLDGGETVDFDGGRFSIRRTLPSLLARDPGSFALRDAAGRQLGLHRTLGDAVHAGRSILEHDEMPIPAKVAP